LRFGRVALPGVPVEPGFAQLDVLPLEGVGKLAEKACDLLLERLRAGRRRNRMSLVYHRLDFAWDTRDRCRCRSPAAVRLPIAPIHPDALMERPAKKLAVLVAGDEAENVDVAWTELQAADALAGDRASDLFVDPPFPIRITATRSANMGERLGPVRIISSSYVTCSPGLAMAGQLSSNFCDPLWAQALRRSTHWGVGLRRSVDIGRSVQT